MNTAEAMEWLAGKQFGLDGANVTYSRGSTIIEVEAIRGRTRWDQTSPEEMMVRYETHDFIVRASELTALGTPEPGDTIQDGDAVYEVLPEGAGSAWEWADSPNRTTYRIHAKHREDVA